MRAISAIALIAFASANILTAQQVKRPSLEQGADTNSAQAYYDLGLTLFERDPERSADAFYWATRLNPGMGSAFYGRKSALTIADKDLLSRSMQRGRNADSKELRSLDSMQLRALMLSPFLYRQFDRTLFTTYIRNTVISNSRKYGGGEPDRGELDMAIERYLREGGTETRGWLAYSDGTFDIALDLYSKAIGSARDKAALRLDRASIFAMRNEADSAIAEAKLALEEMRKKDKKDLVILYNSKAFAEYMIATLLESRSDMTGAREAYGRALQEDLAYYPAHMRLGMLALGMKDTTTALSELALAAQAAPNEPLMRYSNAYVMITVGHYADAAEELKKTIALEPYFALPYMKLGQVSELRNNANAAAAAYTKFLQLAAATDPDREAAAKRLAYVKEFVTAAP